MCTGQSFNGLRKYGIVLRKSMPAFHACQPPPNGSRLQSWNAAVYGLGSERIPWISCTSICAMSTIPVVAGFVCRGTFGPGVLPVAGSWPKNGGSVSYAFQDGRGG